MCKFKAMKNDVNYAVCCAKKIKIRSLVNGLLRWFSKSPSKSGQDYVNQID